MAVTKVREGYVMWTPPMVSVGLVVAKTLTTVATIVRTLQEHTRAL